MDQNYLPFLSAGSSTNLYNYCSCSLINISFKHITKSPTEYQGVAEGEERNPKGTNTGNDIMKLHGQLNISMSSGQQNWTRSGHCCFIHSVLKSSQFWPSPCPPLPSPAFSISLHCLHFLRGHLNIFVFSNVS